MTWSLAFQALHLYGTTARTSSLRKKATSCLGRLTRSRFPGRVCQLVEKYERVMIRL